MKRLTGGALITALIILIGLSSACQECDEPYWDCGDDEQEEPLALAPTLQPVNSIHCSINDRMDHGQYYWGTVMRWTGATTLIVTNVNWSSSEHPDTDSENHLTYDLSLADAVAVNGRAHEAAAIQAKINPPGSWLRFRAMELEEGAMFPAVTENHHGWSVEVALIEEGAAVPTEEAADCVQQSDTAKNEREEQQNRSDPSVESAEKPNLVIEETESEITVRMTDGTGAVLAEQTVARQARRDARDESATTGEPTPRPADAEEKGPRTETAATNTPTPEASQPPDLATWGIMPSAAGAHPDADHRPLVIAGCHIGPPGKTGPTKWALISDTSGTFNGSNAIALHDGAGITMTDGQCYVFAAERLGADEWLWCDENPYGGAPCRIETNGDTRTTAIAVFRLVEGAMRGIGRAWVR